MASWSVNFQENSNLITVTVLQLHNSLVNYKGHMELGRELKYLVPCVSQVVKYFETHGTRETQDFLF